MLSAIVVLAALVALSDAAPPEHASGKLDHILPIPDENDSFETIRKNNKLYVDQTPALVKLLEGSSKSFYLTRPRKFGKTVFLRMMRKFFLGESALFEKLAIFERGNLIDRDYKRSRYAKKKEEKWIKYPVIYHDFGRADFRTASVKDFRRLMLEDLSLIARSLKQSPNKVDIGTLIASLHRVFDLPVVILVDAFDAPILHAYGSNDVERAKGILAIIQEVFTMIEESRAQSHVGLTFVTGVSRFKVFTEESGAKNVVDLTEDKDFATAIGFTVKEVESQFETHLKQFARNRNLTREQIMKELTEWYEGYQFSSKEKSKVLNPVSVNKCLQNHKFDSYWCATGPTKDVMDIFVKEKWTVGDFENFRIDRESLFKMYDADDGQPPFYCFMLHEGYLMIQNYDRNDDMCVLDYPNKEIKQFLSDRLSSYVVSEKKFISELPEWGKQLQEAMRDQKIPTTMEVLKRYGFPILTMYRSESGVWDWGVTRRLRLIFEAASIKCPQAVEGAAEIPATKTDVRVQTQELPINYVFETECEKGVQDAILRLINFAQNESDAFKKSIDQQKKVYLVGLGFTESGQGQLEDWICLPYEQGELKFDEVQAKSQDSVDYVKKLRKT